MNRTFLGLPVALLLPLAMASPLSCGASSDGAGAIPSPAPDASAPSMPAEAGLAPSPGTDRLCDPSFAPSDVAITDPGMDMTDIEFDYVNYRFTSMIGPNRQVVVATLDGKTGDLIASSMVVVDGTRTATQNCAGLGIGNGPEWAISTTYGPELYWNRIVGIGKVEIARATQAQGISGPWTITALPGSAQSSCALPSYNPTDKVPLLTYVQAEPSRAAAWVTVEQGAVPQTIPELTFTDATGASPGRQVPGRREIVFAALDGSGQLQIARKQLETGLVDLVSAYPPGSAVVKSVSVVQAPKYGPDAYFFYANVDSDHIDVFLSRRWGENEKAATLRPPVSTDSPNVFLNDDENVVVGNASYVTIIMGSEKKNFATSSEIWIANAEAKDACDYRRVTRAEAGSRTDPEAIALDDAAFVYFLERGANGNTVLHRAATGLRKTP